ALDKFLNPADRARWQKLQIFDFPSFLAQKVLPTRSDWPRLPIRAVLHPTCTLIKIGGIADLRRVAQTFAQETEIPVLAECCGFAGDKGFAVPELTLSATKPESDEVKLLGSGPPIRCFSTCRTCEIGMTAGSGKIYQ